MRYDQIKAKAEEMGVNVRHAVWCRVRYLRQRIVDELETLDRLANRSDETGEILFPQTRATVIDLMSELCRLKMASEEKHPQRDDSITPEMIEAARNTPIESLVPFIKGKAVAPCHDDKNPSLSHDRKHNRAHCFVCNKSFNAVDYIMTTEGIDFVTAVRKLAA